jgi:hypothetical protein
MSLALLVLGLVVAASGLATIGFGIPINEFTLGTTLIVAGTTALTGGLVLIGISALLAELARLRNGGAGSLATLSASGTEAQPNVSVAPTIPGPLSVSVAGPRLPTAPAVPSRAKPETQAREARPAPAPVSGPSSVEVSAAAIERLRSTIPRNENGRPAASGELEEVPLSPNNEPPQQQAPAGTAPEIPIAEPRVTAEDRTPAQSATEALKASRLDFLFRSKPARPVRQPENFDAIWPAETRGNKTRPPELQAKHERVERRPAARPPVPPESETKQEQVETRPAGSPVRAEPAPAEPPQVVKSGVVDGMAYTLYADGSIEANLPEGTVRFGSIAELRAHIESSS